MGRALKRLGHKNVREMIGEAVLPAFTKMHGEGLRGLLLQQPVRAPMAMSDERCAKGWEKLASAAKKDGRQDPRTYFEYAMVPSRSVRSSSEA